MTTPAATAAPTASTTWNLDPAHSVAEFKVRHMMISYVSGKFSGLSGVLKLDESDYTRSTVEVSIPADNARTVDETLNAHLKNEDFFHVAAFPNITFQSTNIKSTGGRNYAVTGDLTIRGVTKSVVLAVDDVSAPAKDPWEISASGFPAPSKSIAKTSASRGIQLWNLAACSWVKK